MFENSEAGEFSDDPLGVKVGQRTVRCKDIVIATHNPLVGIADVSRAPASFKPSSPSTPHMSSPVGRRGAGCRTLSSGIPPSRIRYLRVDPAGDIPGGDLSWRRPQDRAGLGYERLYERSSEHCRRKVPGISLSHRWSGQVIETRTAWVSWCDDRPPVRSKGYVVTGLTFGTAAASIIAGAILGEQPPLELSTRAARRFTGSGMTSRRTPTIPSI